MNYFDSSIISFFQGISTKSQLLDCIVLSISNSPLVKGGLICGMYWWLWFRHEDPDEGVRERVLLSIGSSFIALLLGRLLAETLPYRDRPLHDAHLHFKIPCGMDSMIMKGWSSFPSDHAVFFFALATGLLFISKRMGIVALIWVFVFCGLPRVYVGFHYPTDILAGALIGVSYMTLVMTSKIGRNFVRKPMRWLQKYPAWFHTFLFILCLEICETFASVRNIVIPLLRALWTSLVK